MTKRPRLEVIQESSTGLNQKFKDNLTGEIVTRGHVAKNIDKYDGYHVMKVDGKNVIRSNPDGKEGNNLG
ncbi:hypothetical protein MKX41_02425 [Paenibacillus sp. FSL R5-0475]|uniref:hypothetical protein n=1 Tax=Paenibacillus sp. FSL R5-0475 TaxID=2921643 RepID=UPI0030FAF85E